ncbi:retrotrans_gag domain-containing protein [Trichonephila clavipes]|uniref:Retrotrans_gag domain-containing protein n=1 Tax=Trichonephila clavipes TaxID=2585209 RepID=A0A8X6V1H9_TRICX|nr:retrotrans_gag domain-containing protein [Trichonephila clavipes]
MVNYRGTGGRAFQVWIARYFNVSSMPYKNNEDSLSYLIFAPKVYLTHDIAALVAEDIYQALLTREINDTASFIKWCNYIEDMKQKRVGRPKFERLPIVVPVASLTNETDLVSLIRTIVREEVHRLVNQTQESLDSDPQFLEEIVQDEVERAFWPQCQQNLQKLDQDQHTPL